MADDAVSPELEQTYPFSALKGGANVLIFPDLDSANIAYKLLSKIGGCETLGPILMGMSKPVHLLSRGAHAEEIVNVTAIAGGCASDDAASRHGRENEGRNPGRSRPLTAPHLLFLGRRLRRLTRIGGTGERLR